MNRCATCGVPRDNTHETLCAICALNDDDDDDEGEGRPT